AAVWLQPDTFTADNVHADSRVMPRDGAAATLLAMSSTWCPAAAGCSTSVPDSDQALVSSEIDDALRDGGGCHTDLSKLVSCEKLESPGCFHHEHVAVLAREVHLA